MPTMQIAPKLLPLLQKKKRYKVVIGGRGSGKSMTVADIFLMKCQVERAKIAIMREYHSTIDDSVYALLVEEIARLDLQGFLPPQQTKISHIDGGEFRFKGLQRDPAGIRSMTGFNYFVVEEADHLSKEALKVLGPTLRKNADSELWFIANPQSSADPFSRRFLVPYQNELNRYGYHEDVLHLIIMCNHYDNPFFPEVLERDRKWDKAHLSTAAYLHTWEGAYNDEVENSIIPVDWFNAAIDAHKKLGFKPVGPIIASFDPSGLGADAKGFFARQGSVVLDVAFNDKAGVDVNAGCDWALDRAIRLSPDIFTWDAGGLGAGLTRQIHKAFVGKKVEIQPFDGANAVEDPEQPYQDVHSQGRLRTNKQSLKNKRAQFYSRFADRFYNTYRAVVKKEYVDPDTMISIPAELDNITAFRAEVCRVPRKLNPNGVFQIMSKVEMTKQRPPIASPNMADSAMMSMLIPKIHEEYDNTWCESEWG